MDTGAESYRRFLDGDESAFDELLTTYRESLTFFIYRYVNDSAEAEDIAIDTFMELLIHRHRYNFKTPLKTYLFIIARNKAIDRLRHKRRFQTVSLDDAIGVISDEIAPEDAVIQDERRRTVNDAVAKLPDEMKIAVHLVYFEGLSYKETAKVMKKKEKQVDNLLQRAKGELRSILEDKGAMSL